MRIESHIAFVIDFDILDNDMLSAMETKLSELLDTIINISIYKDDETNKWQIYIMTGKVKEGFKEYEIKNFATIIKQTLSSPKVFYNYIDTSDLEFRHIEGEV